MAEQGPGHGRGRGLALLSAIRKIQMGMESSSNSPTPTEVGSGDTQSASASVVSATTVTPTTIGGRGRIAAMMLQKLQVKHEAPPSFVPASDMGPSSRTSSVVGMPIGMGRGSRILQSLKTLQQPRPVSADSAVESMSTLTERVAASTLSSTVASTSVSKASQPKNKYVTDIKDTPPVIKEGTTGVPCAITANYIRLNFEENNVYEYEVDYVPEQDYMHLRFKLLNEHRQYFKTKTFDGRTLYVPHMIPEEALNLVSTNPYDNSKVNIKISLRRKRRLSEMVHIYNVLFKQIMKDLELVRFGRQHFSQHAAIQIPQHKLEVWPGYVTAVDEYEGGLMLTLDSTHRVLRSQTVLSLFKDLVHSEGARWKRAMTEHIVGCSVMTTYNNKLFRVDNIDDSMTPKSTFEKKEDGKPIQISFIDYYKKTYGIDIKDWNQPLLISKEKKKLSGQTEPVEFLICLVPELCQLTGLTDQQRSNFRLMKDVATYTRVTPNQRQAAFKKFINNVMNNQSAKDRLAGWGLSLAPETIEITARTLPPENIYFGGNVTIPGKPNAEWNNEATRNKVMQVVDIVKWAIIHTDRDKQVANDFLGTLRRCCGATGISVSQPEVRVVSNDRTDTYIRALNAVLDSAQLQLVVFLCPTSRDDRYAAIKRTCCVDRPVPSQVINSRTIMNPQKIRAIVQKILLQINCKLGGTLWHIAIPYKTAMVVGMDVYHDGAARKKRSVCAFVASYNQTMTHWYSKVAFQESGQEMVDAIKSCLLDSLKHYLMTNGKLPDRIIMYRDGVSDGQLNAVKEYEVPQMKLLFPTVQEEYKPMLTYIITQKRINTRIYLKGSSGYENPAPGTVVDRHITKRDWFDFLIVPQKVNQGTVTPTHYIVVYDNSGMSPDNCQRFTYKMCHLYYNWPGTVRVPAPCQYAHKLASLVGQSVNAEPSSQLSDKLFFL